MYLFEFESQPDFSPKLVAITKQLKQYFDTNGYPTDFTLDQLLAFFARYDIILDANDLYSMIQVPPLKDLISNIQGQDVIFVGQEGSAPSEEEIPDEEKDGTVEKMAQRAMNKK